MIEASRCLYQTTQMLSKDTGDCLALAKYRNYDAVIQRLAERNLIGAPIVMLRRGE
jgi:hypothetical protein